MDLSENKNNYTDRFINKRHGEKLASLVANPSREPTRARSPGISRSDGICRIESLPKVPNLNTTQQHPPNNSRGRHIGLVIPG